jgi:UDP-N-acetylmuramoylalanine--D-glutamate ligase
VGPGFDLKNKRVLVVGLARTGLVVALFCASRGALVTGVDDKPETQLAGIVPELRAAGVSLFLGSRSTDAFSKSSLIVVSPGVPANLPELAQARRLGIPVWSEIELAWRFLRGRLIAITGSNGKTTTTSLVAHILETAGIKTLMGGNIGTPLLSLVDSSTDAGVTVAEVSSFQLETISEFRPDIAVLLNLTPDHLDRHGSFEEYARAKMRIFENQTERDVAVLNADDEEVSPRQPPGSRRVWFSRRNQVAEGAFLRGDEMVFRSGGLEIPLLRRNDVPLRGDHNVENILAAGAAAYLAGAPPAAIAAGVKSFKAVEHRLEYVGNIGGVEFYNDSKATNVDAALKAIEAFHGPLVVILGGKDKGSPYTALREPLRQRARAVILIGAAAEKIAVDLSGSARMEHARTLDCAVETALGLAKPGDVILLAPACSSFDQFKNYEDRGEAFKRLIARFESGSGGAISNQTIPAKG